MKTIEIQYQCSLPLYVPYVKLPLLSIKSLFIDKDIHLRNELLRMRCANKDYIIEHYYDDVKWRDSSLHNVY